MMSGPTRIPRLLLAQLSSVVKRHLGLNFPEDRWVDLAREVAAAARELGFRETEDFIRQLVESPLSTKHTQLLASHLTVGETYFFRERSSLDVLERDILPGLIRARQDGNRTLRLWSAGCCTGEEAYSLACVLSNLLPDPESWHITLLGTDINPRFLHKANEGIYTEWSFRENPPSSSQRHFANVSGRVLVRDPIKRMVTFSYLNLVKNDYPSPASNTTAMDVILCRNVLMYFSTEVAQRVVQKLYSSLVDGGWLIVSPTETPLPIFSEFNTVKFDHSFFYQRGSGVITTKAPKLPPESSYHRIFPAEPQPLPLRPASTTVSPRTLRKGAGKELCDRNAQDSYEKRSSLPTTDPDAGASVALQARLCANEGKLKEALSWCEQAIIIDKLNPSYHHLRATILQEAGEVDEAIRSLKRALYLDDSFALAHLALGSLAHRRGKSLDADRHLALALALLSKFDPTSEVPDSGGITAQRLAEVVQSMMKRGAAA